MPLINRKPPPQVETLKTIAPAQHYPGAYTFEVLVRRYLSGKNTGKFTFHMRWPPTQQEPKTRTIRSCEVYETPEAAEAEGCRRQRICDREETQGFSEIFI